MVVDQTRWRDDGSKTEGENYDLLDSVTQMSGGVGRENQDSTYLKIKSKGKKVSPPWIYSLFARAYSIESLIAAFFYRTPATEHAAQLRALLPGRLAQGAVCTTVRMNVCVCVCLCVRRSETQLYHKIVQVKHIINCARFMFMLKGVLMKRCFCIQARWLDEMSW